MAPGRIHNVATILAAGGALACAWYAGNIDPVFVAGGIFIGLGIGPDLDVRKGDINLSNVRHLPFIGRPLAEAWRWIWRPYARLVPFHRHWTSHLPLISTTLRLLYLGWWIIPLLWFFQWPPAWTWTYFALVFAGLCISDALHWLMDGMPVRVWR